MMEVEARRVPRHFGSTDSPGWDAIVCHWAARGQLGE